MSTTKDWLEAAKTDQNDRPILKKIHQEDGLLISGDGKRFHILENCHEEYVDWKASLKKLRPIDEGITVVFKTKFLIDALTGLDEVAVLHVSGRSDVIEVNGTVTETKKTKCYAIISPYFNDRIEFWRPLDQEEKKEGHQSQPRNPNNDPNDLKVALEQLLKNKRIVVTTEEKKAIAFAEAVLRRWNAVETTSLKQ